jgi:hypothetical protein
MLFEYQLKKRQVMAVMCFSYLYSSLLFAVSPSALILFLGQFGIQAGFSIPKFRQHRQHLHFIATLTVSSIMIVKLIFFQCYEFK